MKEALARKPKIIVVDPETMLAETRGCLASTAPGTDDALGLAMLNVIIGEDCTIKNLLITGATALMSLLRA